jgi:DNA-binding CsgD family transcriptional regulator/tetratricopeptide (TPR) repeat protein
VIATYRDTELSRRHRLSDTLGALARVPHFLRLHLTGFTAEETRRFLAVAFGAVPPHWLTAAIHDQTEGNPLFLREVTRFLQQQGHFRAGVTDAAVTLPSAIRIPEGVREVIGRRLNFLSGGCNEVLNLAAVIGRDFALDVLVLAGGDRGEEAVFEALDEALAAHIVEETEPGQYQFTHALLRMTLYDELRTGARRRLHRRVGEAIEKLHQRDLELVLPELARHFHAAGFDDDVMRAIDYATRAGRRADALLAFEDAIGLFQTALDLSDHADAADPRQRCGLLLLLGEAQRKANDFPSALQTLESAAEIARAHCLGVDFAHIARAYEYTEWRHGVSPGLKSRPMLEEALADLPDSEVALQVRLAGRLAPLLSQTGATAEAKAMAQRAVAMARTLGDPATLATSLSGLAHFAWEPHETAQAVADAAEMLEMAGRAGDIENVVQARSWRAALSLELADIPTVEAEIAAMVELQSRIRQPVFALFELTLRATLGLLRGQLREAEQLILRAVQVQPESRSYNTDPLAMLIFTLRREQGRLNEIRPLVPVIVRDQGPNAIWRPGLALLHLELGDRDAAGAILEDLARDDFAAVPRDARWTVCLVYLAEVCAALADAPRAAVLYRLLLPWEGRNVVLGSGNGCWGSSSRFLGLLAATMRRWPDAERHFGVAVAMNQRMGAAAVLAHTRLDFAAMLQGRSAPGDPERAAFLIEEAEGTARSLGLTAAMRRVAAARETLAPVSPSAPDDLTARELEVLRLIAIGRGNSDIALALDISLNTVATHVRNILAKTGCANRTEAAGYAIRHGLHQA